MEASHEEYMTRIRELIGDDSVEIQILNTSKWWINETIAEHYSDDNVFYLGDAVHRHPPFNGLGSNTCIQDAFNLAWKISYAMSGQSGRGLLETFSHERQPVGLDIVTRANQGLRDHSGWMKAIGMLEDSVERRKEILAEFEDEGSQGRHRRQEFEAAIANTAHEYHGLGIELNQTYVSSGIYRNDEVGTLPEVDDPVATHLISTFPGRRLPHAWLNSRTPGQRLSTIDLAGHGRFCLLTGPGGREWKAAAKSISKALNVDIAAYSIGWKQDYEDIYFDWAKKRQVEEDGCVLIRPDRFVAWRSQTMHSNCCSKLDKVMKSILSVDM